MITKLYTNLFLTLEHKPHVGIISSFTGWIIGQSPLVATKYDMLLKFATQASIFIGFGIGVLTLILKLVEFIKIFKSKK